MSSISNFCRNCCRQVVKSLVDETWLVYIRSIVIDFYISGTGLKFCDHQHIIYTLIRTVESTTVEVGRVTSPKLEPQNSKETWKSEHMKIEETWKLSV